MLEQQKKPEILISIVIVNYKVPEYLRDTVRSLMHAELFEKSEIIVVDNASGDGSETLITSSFPFITWIQLKNNVGFGKACNIGVQSARGKYILLLNPDTVISENTLTVAVDFMESHPNAGIMGPKILNPDGTLQASCRRGFVTPLVAFYYFIGLSKLFPKSRRFGKYHMTFLDPDKTEEVDAISGSFMFLRHSLYNEVNGFDEQFFMYGEDLDLCWRVRERGYSIWYHPLSQIIHRKGKSSAKSIFRSRMAFYEAMIIFSKKYRHIRGGFFPDWLIFFGIFILSLFNIAANLLRSFIPTLIDASIINLVLFANLKLRFGNNNPYCNKDQILTLIIIHIMISTSFLFMFFYNGIYSKKKYTIVKTFFSCMLASLLFISTIYFMKSMALSRIVFALSSIIISVFLVGWREVIPKVIEQFKQIVFTSDKVIILGNGPIAAQMISNIEKLRNNMIVGIIKDNPILSSGEFHGYPVLGTIVDLRSILQKNHVDSLLIATAQPWYSQIIELLSYNKVKNLTIRWVPDEYFKYEPEQIPDNIILRDFTI